MEVGGRGRGWRGKDGLSVTSLLFLFLLSFFNVEAACPPAESIKPCQCTARAEEVQIWCSGSELASVLAGLAAVGSQTSRPIDELILENNVMTALPGRAFSPLRVVRLMLRDNRLERLAASWLSSLEPSLLELFLVEHELRSLPEDTFEGLVKMEAVTLKAGLVQRLPSFSGLPKLRYLHAELPLLGELGPGRLSGLEALEQLHLVGSPLLTGLPDAVLQDLPRLVLANFSGCGIGWLRPRALLRLPSLKEIDLSGNSISDAGQVGRSIRELPHLAVLKLSGNKVESLRETTFVDIPPLVELYMDNNKIMEVHRGAFHRLPSLVKLDLSNNLIRRVQPEFFLQSYESRLEEVLLMDNRLEEVGSLAVIMDTLPRLKFLDVSGNRVEDIGFGSLRGHPILERLHLNGNRLKRVVREAFTAMPSLIELRLSNNSLSNYLEMPLWNLPALKGLELSENEFRRLDRRVLANLPSLRRLDVSRNNLLVVDPASFLGSSALEHINLSRNAIDSLDARTFANLNGLFELDASWNKLSRFVPGLPRALEYLRLSNNKISSLPRTPSPDLLLPALRLLDLSGNRLTSLPPEGLISMPLLRRLYLAENELSGLDERALDGLGRLELLSLADNRLQRVDRNAFRDLRRVEELDLRGNRLASLDAGLFRENTHLRLIDLSRNQISDLSKATFHSNKELEEVYLSENGLKEFPEAVLALKRLKTLDLGFNRIGQLNRPLSPLASLTNLRLAGNRLATLTEGVFTGLANLTVLDLEGNHIQYITSHVLRSLPALSLLRMSKNRLSSIPSAAFSDLPSLTDVELQENEVTQVASDAFSGVPNLLLLNLSHNHLSSLDRAGLHGVKSVEILDLSFNRIAKLTAPSLPTLDNLIQLKMDGNKLCNIQGSPFNKMTHLRMLSLRNNRLMSLSETAFQPLRATIYQLDIEGNPLKCSCSLLWLQSWVREGPHHGPRCSDGTLLKEREINPGECIQPKSSDLLRHCEDFSPGGVGATQQLSSTSSGWKEPGGGTVGGKPTPEESEYFYEEYVEYDDNTTLPIGLSNFIQSTSPSTLIISSSLPPPISRSPPSIPDTGSTLIPPAVMSHFTPGDTPTIYARPGQGSAASIGSSGSIGGNGMPTKPPSTQFTFFGMPLPSLNIGKFWGSSRTPDGRSRFPSKGHVQQVGPPHSRLPHHPIEEGFKPMIQSSGFRPIFNPYEPRKNSTTAAPVDTTKVPGRASQPALTVLPSPAPTNPISPPPPPSRGPSLPSHFSHHFDFGSTKGPVLPGGSVASESDTKDGERTKVEEERHRFTYNNFSHSSLYEFNKLEPEGPLGEVGGSGYEVGGGGLSLPLPAPTPYVFSSTDSPLTFPDSSEEGNDFVELTQLNELPSSEGTTTASASPTSGGGPAPLSAFLAPGGLLPPYRSGGKPTITKVTMSPVAEASASQGSPPPDSQRAQAAGSGSKPERQGTSKRTDKSIEWYFTNYNRTNIQPYVGRGAPLAGAGSKSSPLSPSLSTVIFILLSPFLITLLQCCNNPS